MPWLTIIILIFLIWFIIVIYVAKRGFKKIRPYGPALMLSTTRGKESIERFGKRKFWSYYGNFSIIIALIFMVLTLALLIWEATLVLGIPKSQAPSPLAALGIPGINPFIPVTYGIIAIIVAVVVHELSHGLLSANNDIDIKSMGILLFIVPVGAFVEPDEEKLSKAKRRARMKVFSAGPSTNMIYAFVFLALFLLMLSSVSSPSQGALVTYSGNGFINQGDLIVSVGNFSIKDSKALNTIGLDPGIPVAVKAIRDSHTISINTTSGLWVNSVVPGSPAYKAGIKPGEILISINGKMMRNGTSFNSFMENTTAGESIHIVMMERGNEIGLNITLVDKYSFYQVYAPNYNSESYKGKGFLGVAMAYMNISYSDPSTILGIVANPFSGGIFPGIITLITLPFIGLSPFPSYFASIYSVPFSPIIFWPLANLVYWIFWINLMLGLTNVLPLLPLDGGYVLRDLLSGMLERWKIAKHEKIASGVTAALSLIVVFLIIWQFIYPRLF